MKPRVHSVTVRLVDGPAVSFDCTFHEAKRGFIYFYGTRDRASVVAAFRIEQIAYFGRSGEFR